MLTVPASPFGRFLLDSGCYEITAEPPRKWRNILYNAWGPEEYYAEATHIGDGMSRYKDAEGNTVTVIGYDAKYLYIRDDETNQTFCPAGAPLAQPVENRSILIHPSKTEIRSECFGLAAAARYFVPRSELAECWTLTLKNRTDKTRHVSVFGYAMFQLTGSDKEGKGFWKDNYSEIHPDLGGVLVINRQHFLPHARRHGFLFALENFRAANGYRDHMTAADYGYGAPKILQGWNCDNRADYGPDCAGVVQVTVTIPPRGTARADFVVGPCTDLAEALAIKTRLSPERLDALAQEQSEIERQRASAFSVDTGPDNAARDALINIFVKKQIYSYLVDKTGVRDNLQNDNAVVLFDPPLARANILKVLAVQRPDGSSLHSWRPYNRHHYSDKPAWPLQTVPWYIKETGDFSILDETVPFFESDESAPVLEHLKRAFRHLATDLGKRGLCRQHFADWNDGLEPSEKTGERESVMVSQQLCAGLLEIGELAAELGDDALVAECAHLHAEMAKKIVATAWDGEWFTRTICEDGYALGSSKADQARIFVNTQSWAVLGRVADESTLRQCMASVDRYLTKPEGIPICDPPCSRFDERIGRYTTVMPYSNENGGCYNHAAGFKTIADCLLGRAEEAWQTFVKVAPDNPANPVTQSWVEPFSFTNSYSRIPFIAGRSGYAWRTGTAAWFTVALLEYILGARRSYKGLLVDPCLSKSVPRATVKRTFRGATYIIEIHNTAGRCRGLTSLAVDGSPVQGNTLPDFRSGTHYVTAII